MTPGFRPFIVGVGGTTRPGSSSERALRIALANAAAEGARTEVFDGPSLTLPMYAAESSARTEGALRLIAALRSADGVILASPGYHGSVSGLVKNALDYIEDMRGDPLPYLEGRAVGLIACASGWQATGTTLMALRSIVHALRGWPTPMAVAINTAAGTFTADGSLADTTVASQLRILSAQVVEFARLRSLRELGKREAAMSSAS